MNDENGEMSAMVGDLLDFLHCSTRASTFTDSGCLLMRPKRPTTHFWQWAATIKAFATCSWVGGGSYTT